MPSADGRDGLGGIHGTVSYLVPHRKDIADIELHSTLI